MRTLVYDENNKIVDYYEMLDYEYDKGFEAGLVRKKLDMAKAFTKTYKDNINKHIAIKEAMCLKEQYPALCSEIKEYDLICGRQYFNFLVGFGLEILLNKNIPIIQYDNIPETQLSELDKQYRKHLSTSACGYAFDYSGLMRLLERDDITQDEKDEIKELMDFWYNENTVYKYRKVLPDEISNAFGRTCGQCQGTQTFFRVCCISVDFDKLLQLGIPGMKKLINKKRESYISEDKDTGLYDGMLLALGLLINVCKFYERHCLDLMEKSQDIKRKDELRKMAAALHNITETKPENLQEAVQLFWLYNILTDAVNFGRMDVYLGDFYIKDIENGTETKESAKDILKSVWMLIYDRENEGTGAVRYNSRVILGGKSRRNPENANAFAMAAMEVTKELKLCEPMVTLRFYKGQNPALMDLALECIGEGCVNPILYNDDVNIAWIAKAYNISIEEAENYIPEGCGEIMIDHKSVGSPNNIFNYSTILDYVLHNGYSTEIGEQRGLSLGEIKDFDTFEKLLDAFEKQVDYINERFAKRQAIEHKIHGENSAYLFLSMLTDDCIERGKGIFEGGVRYAGGIIETFGLTTVADGLYAINELVYKRKVFTLEQIVEMIDKDFKGYEKERQMLLSAPKFGNDIKEIDDFYTYLSNYVCQSAYNHAKPAGLHFFLNCNLNPGGPLYGRNTKASADGRFFGDALAVGNAPTAGRDKNGITALLNSMTKADHLHSGYVNNLKVSKGMFDSENIDRFRALLDTYFEQGGSQIMITVINKEDLENALKEPEKYTHIMVRVGGWTARFVELPPFFQKEIMNRTLYC